LFPLRGRSKTIEVKQGSAVYSDMADLDYSTQANEVLVIDLVLSE
jgi:hypothetical protein